MTDVGSVKGPVIGLVAPHLDMRRFVPGHPVAGTENSGPDAAVANLYRDRWCILTPTPDTDPGAVARVSALLDGLSVATLVYRSVTRAQLREWVAAAVARELGLDDEALL